jgi:hypothetical protein
MRFIVEIPDNPEGEVDVEEFARGLNDRIGSGSIQMENGDIVYLQDVRIEALDDATEDELEAATDIHGSDEIEIDRPAAASRSDEGVWVQGWLWVPIEALES